MFPIMMVLYSFATLDSYVHFHVKARALPEPKYSLAVRWLITMNSALQNQYIDLSIEQFDTGAFYTAFLEREYLVPRGVPFVLVYSRSGRYQTIVLSPEAKRNFFAWLRGYWNKPKEFKGILGIGVTPNYTIDFHRLTDKYSIIIDQNVMIQEFEQFSIASFYRTRPYGIELCGIDDEESKKLKELSLLHSKIYFYRLTDTLTLGWNIIQRGNDPTRHIFMLLRKQK
ncbi:MAG: hypothetical protein ACRC8S_10295 [Fimbriiglobus sp.]